LNLTHQKRQIKHQTELFLTPICSMVASYVVMANNQSPQIKTFMLGKWVLARA